MHTWYLVAAETIRPPTEARDPQAIRDYSLANVRTPAE
jgi:hypothetical protein